jgi:hypothetical protein
LNVEGDFVDLKHVTQDEREALYAEVWAEPVTTVAQRYEMSDNALRKHCKRLGIPLPPVGYWTKIKAGQKVPKPALPAVTGELKKYVRNYVIKYRADIDQLTDAELMSDEELSLYREETKIFIRETCSKILVKGQLRNPHNLITAHKEEVTYRRKRDKVLKQASFNSNYYASEKSKYRDNKAMLPIYVSEANINRAYRILNNLINTLEDMESYTRVDQASGTDTAYFIVMRSTFHFVIKEEVRKGRASKNNNEAYNSLVLEMTASSWFSNSGNLQIKYKDNDNEPLEAQVGKIVYDMFVVTSKLQAEDELQDRKQKRIREERERQRRLEQMRKGELDEVKLLEQAASDWEKSQKIRRFADCVESKIAGLGDAAKKDKLFKWVRWARDKADWLDPLTEKDDDLLGKSQHLFELIDNEDF